MIEENLDKHKDLRCYMYCKSLYDSKGSCLKYNEKLEFIRGVTQSISGYIMCKKCQNTKKLLP